MIDCAIDLLNVKIGYKQTEIHYPPEYIALHSRELLFPVYC
jgi:hypothetical protein